MLDKSATNIYSKTEHLKFEPDLSGVNELMVYMLLWYLIVMALTSYVGMGSQVWADTTGPFC